MTEMDERFRRVLLQHAEEITRDRHLSKDLIGERNKIYIFYCKNADPENLFPVFGEELAAHIESEINRRYLHRLQDRRTFPKSFPLFPAKNYSVMNSWWERWERLPFCRISCGDITCSRREWQWARNYISCISPC